MRSWWCAITIRTRLRCGGRWWCTPSVMVRLRRLWDSGLRGNGKSSHGGCWVPVRGPAVGVNGVRGRRSRADRCEASRWCWIPCPHEHVPAVRQQRAIARPTCAGYYPRRAGHSRRARDCARFGPLNLNLFVLYVDKVLCTSSVNSSVVTERKETETPRLLLLLVVHDYHFAHLTIS